MRVPYSWLLKYLKTDTPAEELAHVLTMGGLEVEEIHDWTSEDGQARDQVLVTSVTSNRGDLLSMVGVARHAAALLRCDWQAPDLSRPEIASPAVGAPLVELGDVKIEVLDFDACPRYSALVIRDLKIGPSPDWMRYHLEAAGIRPICNVVDVTNYVCWELGQPMHAFDLRLLARNHIIVRKANPGERILLIDDSTHELTENDLAICDEMGPAALAGIMGGLDTSVRERTVSLLLESAHFDPTSIRRSAQRHGLGSESSYRFERHVDPNLTLPAIARATELIVETAGGTPDATAFDVRARDFEPKRVVLRPERCNAILGTDIAPESMADYLSRIGMKVESADGMITAEVPTVRPDIEREIDLIEEVAIIHGYNNLPITVPGKLNESGMLTRRQSLRRKTSQVLRQCGLNETIGFSFMDMAALDRCEFAPDACERVALQLLLPVSPDMAHLRTTLIPGLLGACAVNVRQRVLDVALFELDRVFIPVGENTLPKEQEMVGGVLMGMQFTSAWNLPQEAVRADFYWAKGVVEQLCDALNVEGVRFERGAHSAMHPGRCAQVLVGDTVAGYVGEVKASVQESFDLPTKAYVFELNWDLLAASAGGHRQYEPLSRFPAASRDIALLVADDDAHSAEAIREEIRASAGPNLWHVEAFDLFIDPERLGPGRKSVAFRLTFRAADRTLTDEELDAAMGAVVDQLRSSLGAEIRDR